MEPIKVNFIKKPAFVVGYILYEQNINLDKKMNLLVPKELFAVEAPPKQIFISIEWPQQT